MRAVVQRVTQASVSMEGGMVSRIGKGLCVLVGITQDDDTADMDYMVKKILGLKVFDDPITGKMWSKGLQDLHLEVLCVSQFTLYGSVNKGFKPDFHHAMSRDTSHNFYAEFLNKLRQTYDPEKIQDGVFGAMMLVNIVNDGPVTLTLDSRKFEYKEKPSKKERMPPSASNHSELKEAVPKNVVKTREDTRE